MARFWMWGARLGRSRRRSAGRSPHAMPGVGSPGCTARRCDAHHITHWCDGGRTSLDNLMLLCRRHHRLVHEGGFQAVQDRTGDVTFISADGRRLEPSPPLPSRAANDLDHDHDVGAHSLPCWDGTPFNLAYTIDVLRGHEPFGSGAGQPSSAESLRESMS